MSQSTNIFDQSLSERLKSFKHCDDEIDETISFEQIEFDSKLQRNITEQAIPGYFQQLRTRFCSSWADLCGWSFNDNSVAVDSKLRVLARKITTNRVFYTSVAVLIVANIIIISLFESMKSNENVGLFYIELAFNIIFSIEIWLKILASPGRNWFFSFKHFISDGWNKFDLLVVSLNWIPSIVSIFSRGSLQGFGNFSTLRAIRVIRILRVAGSSFGSRVLLETIYKSLPMLSNSIFLVAFLVFVFSMIGNQIFSGLLRQKCYSVTGIEVSRDSNGHLSCDLPSDGFYGSYTCEAGERCLDHDPVSGATNRNPSYGLLSFDNIGLSFLAVMSCVSLEGWVSIMYSLWDSAGGGVCFFFILAVVVCGLFAVNLIAAIIYNVYNQINNTKEEVKVSYVPTTQSPIQSKRNLIVLDYVVQVVTVINVVLLASEYHGQPDYWTLTLEYSNIAFTIIYLIELSLHCYSEGVWKYLTIDGFNQIDTVVVVLSVLEIVLVYFAANNLASGIRALRALRILKTLKLFSKSRSIKIILKSLFDSSIALRGFVIIMIVFVVFYGLMGLQIFSERFHEVTKNDDYVTRPNFLSLWSSFLLTIQIITGEDWNGVMYQHMDALASSSNSEAGYGLLATVAALYFVSLFILGNYLLMSLFLAILLDNFQNQTCKPETAEGSEVEVLVSSSSDLESKGTIIPRTATKQETWQTILSDSNKLPFQMQYISEEEMIECFKAMASGVGGVPRGVYERRGSRKYFDCFAASLLIDWLMDLPDPMSRENAIMFGQQMLKEGKIFAIDDTAKREVRTVKLRKIITSIPRQFLKQSSSIVNIFTSDFAMTEQKSEFPELELKLSPSPLSSPSNASGRPKSFRVAKSEFTESGLYRFEMRRVQVSELIARTTSYGAKKAEADYKTQDQKKRRESLNSEEFSLGLLSTQHWLRKFCIDLLLKPQFDIGIIIVIIFSCVMLVLEGEESAKSREVGERDALIFFVAEVAVTICFTAEMFIKIIASGMRTYLKDGWCVLDAFIVGISILSVALSIEGSLSGISSVLAIRALRSLRPLRMISYIPGLSLVVNTLIQTLPSVANVAIVAGLIFLVFGILGGTFFRGKLFYCQVGNDYSDILDIQSSLTPDFPLDIRYSLDRTDCHGNATISWRDLHQEQYELHWSNEGANFDNIGASLITLFEVASLEGWINIMVTAADSVEENKHPVRDHTAISYIFFIVFTITGGFLVVNLLISVVINKFTELRDERDGKSIFLTGSQETWLNAHKEILAAKPSIEKKKPPSRYFVSLRLPLYKLIKMREFELFITASVILNLIFMATFHFDQSSRLSEVQFWADVVFSAIFCMEALIKILALGLGQYFKISKWNIFDFTIVSFSIIDIIQTSLDNDLLPFPPTLLRIIRLFRILRFVRVNQRIQVLVQTLALSLVSVVNILLLVCLVFFIFSILALSLFGDAVIHGIWLTDYSNFKTFGSCMVTLFRCSTGEDWNAIMHALYEQGYKSAPMFFLLFVLVSDYLILNLFVAVLMDHFSEVAKLSSTTADPKTNVRSAVTLFAEAWGKIDPKSTMRVPGFVVPWLLYTLPSPIGFHNTVALLKSSYDTRYLAAFNEFVINYVRSLRIRRDKFGFVFFVDVLSACIRTGFKLNDVSMEEMEVELSSFMNRHSYHLPKATKKVIKTAVEDNDDEKMSNLNVVWEDLDLSEEFNAAILVQSSYRRRKKKKKKFMMVSNSNVLNIRETVL